MLGTPLLLAVAARAALPGVARERVQRALDHSREYDGSFGAVRMRLWRGAYVIENIELIRNVEGERIPFFRAPRIDIAIEWGALVRGRVVGRMVVDRPQLEFVDTADSGVVGVDAGGSWLSVIDGLFPFQLDRGEVRNGRARFRAPGLEPPVDIALSNVEIRIENLTNVRDRLTVNYATVEATAVALGHAPVEFEMTLDPTAYRPTFSLALRLLDLDVTAANDLVKAYANLDFHDGRFDLVVELEAVQGELEGYVKPLFRGLQVFELTDIVEQDPLTAFWNALVGLVTSLLQNPPADQFGTLIPLSGSLGSPDADLLATVLNILRNAFVRAFLPTLEGDRGGAASGLVFGTGSVFDTSPPR